MVRFMVFNATFNNISVISWRSVLLMEETGVPGENHRQVCNEYIFCKQLRCTLLSFFSYCLHIHPLSHHLGNFKPVLRFVDPSTPLSQKMQQNFFSKSMDLHIRVMMFNATFNNISAVVLYVEARENNRRAESL